MGYRMNIIEFLKDLIKSLFKTNESTKDEIEEIIKIETIPVKINNIRIESLSGQEGDAIKKIWVSPVKLHAIVEIEEAPNSNFNKQYNIYCKINKNGEIAKDVEFIHGNTGCENPCMITQLEGQGINQVVFTFEVFEPGEYEVIIGEKLKDLIKTSFEVIDE